MTFTPVWTQEQLIERIIERKPADRFAFEWTQYADYLTGENVKPFLPEHAKPETWDGPGKLTRDHLTNVMHDYMSFAWDKANSCRGISANRSVRHYIAWTWLAGDVELSDKVNAMFERNYCYYGKPILWTICQHYGWDHGQWDNDNWTSVEGELGPTAERVIENMGLRTDLGRMAQ